MKLFRLKKPITESDLRKVVDAMAKLEVAKASLAFEENLLPDGFAGKILVAWADGKNVARYGLADASTLTDDSVQVDLLTEDAEQPVLKSFGYAGIQFVANPLDLVDIGFSELGNFDVKKYDPEESRDSDGRWTSGGDSGKEKPKLRHISIRGLDLPSNLVSLIDKYNDAVSAEKTELAEHLLKEIRHDSEDLDYDQREALGLKKYNPEEPRDRGGRWTRDGNYHRLSPELYAKVKRRSSGPGGAVELSSNEVKEILEKGVFALISGGPSPHDPPSMTAEQVEQRHKSLVADLTEAGYMHTDATGFYNGKENSMLVMTHDADREEMFALGQKYNQDSVIYANNGSNQMLFTRGPNEGKMHVGDGYDDAKDFLDFYTQIETSDKKTEKFSLHFDFANFKTKGSNRFREDLHPRAQGGRFGVKPDKDDGKPYDSVAVPEGRIPIREMVQHYQDLRKRDPRQAAKLRDKIKEIIHKYNLDPEKVWGEDPDDPKKRKPSDKTKIDDIDDSDFDEDELEFTAGNTEKRKALRELKDHLKSWKGKPARPKKDNTEMQYTVEDFDSKGMSRKYTPERSELHNKIIDFFFAGVKPVDSPVAHMMGGGPASGKSSVIKSGDVKTDSNSVAIDPDMIKKYLPEYLPGVAKRDDGIASFVHEESSWLGKVLTDKAASGNFNLLIDGTGNTSFESVKSKVEALRKKGFTPDRIRATYVTVDIEEAFKRNDERFAKTGRKVPTSFVEECHAHVSDIVPKLMQDGTFSELELYDTNNGKVPVKVASYVNGKMEILNLSLWDRFLRKSEFLQSQKYKDILAAREAADKPKKKKKSAEAPHESDLATDVRNHLLGRESALPDFLLEELAEKNQGWYVPSEWTV